MLKSDFRYIIKKIIIGIGIILGISFIRSCKVYALDSSTYTSLFYNQMNYQNSGTPQCYTAGTKFKYVINGHEYNIEYKNDGNNLTGLYINDMQVASENFSNCNPWLLGKWPGNDDSVVFYYISYTQSKLNTIIAPSVLNYPDNFPVSIDYLFVGYTHYAPNRIRYNFSNGNYISHNSVTLCHTSNCNVTINGYSYANQFLGGYNLLVYGTNQSFQIFQSPNVKYITSNYNSPNYILRTSSINSLNPTPILSNDNSILLGYNFRLNFTNFDTRYFVYKYRVGNSRTLILNSNNYDLSVRNNDTLYVWVEDLQGNVVDSETFTVSNVGNLYEGEYSIDFTYKDIAPSDTENSTGLSNIIDRVDISITYLPKTNILKYQYQYVNSGGSLDPQNWTQLNNNNSLNEYTYVAHDNGTLYARILDQNDNVVANNTFTVDSIGKSKLFNDNNNIGGIFDNIKNNIDYSGPIYSLILMPINFINTIYSNSSNTCQRYKLGILFNNDIYFECVDFSDYIGSDLYHLIDILCASGVIYGIALFIKKKYNQFTSLSDNDNDIM